MPDKNLRPDSNKNITGSYPGAAGGYHIKNDSDNAGGYTVDNDIPRANTGEINRRSQAVRSSKDQKKAPGGKFDFKALFSSENMKAFYKHLAFYGCIVLVSLLLAFGIITVANDVYAFIKPNEEIVVSIPEGSSTSDIASTLKGSGVIDHPFVFKLYSRLKKADGQYQFGEYTLNSNMTYDEIISELKKSSVQKESVKFTIPEGYEQNQIVDLLVEKGYCERDSLEDALQNHEYDYDFLKDLPERRDRLEGYLFPDTYEIYVGEDAVSIVNRMLKNFETKVLTDENKKLIEKSDLSLDELITLASIVEREGQAAEELPKVASVFYNRLNSPTYSYLESCATIQYVLPERKEVLSIADTKTDSPYNTYMHKGLPPGPISCPGLAAISAVLEPETTDYYYFVSNKDGTHLFAKTYSEHLANIERAGSSSSGTGTVS